MEPPVVNEKVYAKFSHEGVVTEVGDDFVHVSDGSYTWSGSHEDFDELFWREPFPSGTEDPKSLALESLSVAFIHVQDAGVCTGYVSRKINEAIMSLETGAVLTEGEWTRVPPEKEGWWAYRGFRGSNDPEPAFVWNCNGHWRCRMDGEIAPVAAYHGLWWTIPLDLPE